MENIEELNELRLQAEELGFYCSLRKHDPSHHMLVCCSELVGGNCFHVLFSKEHNTWFLGTWSPKFYMFCENDKNVVFSHVLELLGRPNGILWELPQEVIDNGIVIEISGIDDIYE